MELFITISLAFISGVIPAIIWFFFWNYEDSQDPEPKSMLALAFIGGMVAVFISLFIEKYLFGIGIKNLFYTDFLKIILSVMETIALKTHVDLEKIALVVIFAPVIEEVAKFIMAYTLTLRSKASNEPLDPMIYMITTALGFAAIENTLFLIGPFERRDFVLTIFTGNMRFIGATLLHVVSSATVALFISFHFFNSRSSKMWYTIIGIVCAIILHAIFNFLMIGDQQANIMALELIWITVIIILLAFEKIKKIRREYIYN